MEVSANKSLPELIEVVYRNREKVELCRKVVKIETEWVHLRCAECCIFGHTDKNCVKQNNKEAPEVIEVEKEQNNDKNQEAVGKDNEGFQVARNKNGNAGGNRNRTQNVKPNAQFQKR